MAANNKNDDEKPFYVERNPDYFDEYDGDDYGFDYDLGESEVY